MVVLRGTPLHVSQRGRFKIELERFHSRFSLLVSEHTRVNCRRCSESIRKYLCNQYLIWHRHRHRLTTQWHRLPESIAHTLIFEQMDLPFLKDLKYSKCKILHFVVVNTWYIFQKIDTFWPLYRYIGINLLMRISWLLVFFWRI